MSLTRWILDRFTNRRTKRADLRRTENIVLYLRRMEDRRVLSLSAISDAYFVEGFETSFSASPQLGVLANDFGEGGRGTVEAVDGTFMTDLGGTMTLWSDGSFSYALPMDKGSIFTDFFTYTATDGIEFTNAEVTLFVGEVPVAFNQPTILPIFGVETLFPSDFVEVNLFSMQGATLTLLNDSSVNIIDGNNGGGSLTFSGIASDVNLALDTLEYDPLNLIGYDDLFFSYTIFGGPPQQAMTEGQINPPPEGQTEPPPEGFQTVPIFIAPPSFPGEVVTVDDEYFVESPMTSVFFSGQASVLSNDFSNSESFFYADPGQITTSLGGSVFVNTDGSFSYTAPTDPFLGPTFIDSFVYFARTEGQTSTPGFVTIFVGEVPVIEDQPVLLPLFSVESELPSDQVTVEITSLQGASLSLIDTFGITFESFTNNGERTIIFRGTAEDVNFALDLLVYAPPLDYSGGDLVSFKYMMFGEPFLQTVPINVLPVADPPQVSVTPPVVKYLPVIPVPVDINVALVDVDGSEIPGLVILQNVPQGVIPSVGQQLPNDPGTYLLLPGELENLFFVIGFSAPEFFTIDVIATSIETTNQPGVFGGPGGPLLPDQPFDPRFAAVVTFVDFVRLPMPDEPPPKPKSFFLLGPLSDAPPPKLHDGPDRKAGPDAPILVASLFESHHSSHSHDAGTPPVLWAAGSEEASSDSVTSEERNDDQSRRSSESSGIYVRKLGSDDPDQFTKLPPELSEDYPRFMAFLKTLPNGDYVVYFKQGGQSHEQAALRQVVVRVRVVNHRLNPDPGEFKPAGEVAEPPQDPREAPSAPANEEQTQLLPPHKWILSQKAGKPTAALEGWTPITAGAGVAALAGWKLHIHHQRRSNNVDQLMEQFPKKPSWRFLRGQRPEVRG